MGEEAEKRLHSGHVLLMVAALTGESAHTEQHAELQSGLEAIKGVTSAVIVPRPAKMRRMAIE